jgi:hypothetical protein
MFTLYCKYTGTFNLYSSLFTLFKAFWICQIITFFLTVRSLPVSAFFCCLYAGRTIGAVLVRRKVDSLSFDGRDIKITVRYGSDFKFQSAQRPSFIFYIKTILRYRDMIPSTVHGCCTVAYSKYVKFLFYGYRYLFVPPLSHWFISFLFHHWFLWEHLKFFHWLWLQVVTGT